MMADTVVFLLQRVAAEMAAERASNATAPPPPPHAVGEGVWLPPPLVEGNTPEAADPTCHFGEDLHRIITRNEVRCCARGVRCRTLHVLTAARLHPRTFQSWAYLADDEKPGFITNVSGAVLEMQLGATQQAITLSYLKSFRFGMGAAKVSCVEGCTCEPFALDGREKLQRSIMVQHNLPVSQAQNCTMRLVVEPLPPIIGDGPVGSTFKLMGVTVSGKSVAAHAAGLGNEARGKSRVNACVHACADAAAGPCAQMPVEFVMGFGTVGGEEEAQSPPPQ